MWYLIISYGKYSDRSNLLPITTAMSAYTPHSNQIRKHDKPNEYLPYNNIIPTNHYNGFILQEKEMAILLDNWIYSV